MCRIAVGHSTTTIFHYSRLSLREWFMLILLFLGLHNSCSGLSWLFGRSYMPIFKALKRLMLSLRRGKQSVKMDGASSPTRST